MRFDDASHPGFGRLVIEKNTPAPIDLDVYESASPSPKPMLSIRPSEILTDAGPRMAVPSKRRAAAIVKVSAGSR